MTKCVLITRPDHDVTTRYLYYWNREIIEQAHRSGFDVVDLKRDRANKKEFTSVLNKIQPALVVLNGHGDDQVVMGFDNEVLVKSGANHEILRGRITYALACSSAKKLGRVAVKDGSVAYLGYDDDFIFQINSQKIAKPLEDRIAKRFLEPSNQLPVAIMKGSSTGGAYKRSQANFRRNIQKLLSSESPQVDRDLIPYLLWDMRHQVALGDWDAKI